MARNKKSRSFDYRKIKYAFLILRSINNDLRKRIIELLETKGALNVTEIHVALRVHQTVASQHLAIMRRAQVLNTERQGKSVYYSLNKPRVAQIVQFNNDIITFPN